MNRFFGQQWLKPSLSQHRTHYLSSSPRERECMSASYLQEAVHAIEYQNLTSIFSVIFNVSLSLSLCSRLSNRGSVIIESISLAPPGSPSSGVVVFIFNSSECCRQQISQKESHGRPFTCSNIKSSRRKQGREERSWASPIELIAPLK